MTTRPQDIADRIDCWKRAYDAVLAELVNPVVPPVYVKTLVEAAERGETMSEWDGYKEIAARTAATLAIGATTRGRGE